MTTISDCDDAYSVHSGSVNLEQKNGRREGICQLDGAGTPSERSFIDTSHRIPVVTGVARDLNPRVPRLNRVLRPIIRNKRINISTTLPVIAVANCRSLQPKLESTIEKVINESIGILLL